MADPDNTGEVLGDHIALVRQLEFDRMKTLESRGERVLRTDLAVLAAVVAGLTLLLGRSVPQHLHTATLQQGLAILRRTEMGKHSVSVFNGASLPANCGNDHAQ